MNKDQSFDFNMDWGQSVLLLFIMMFLIFFILRDDDDADFIYTTSVPIGLPIVTNHGNNLLSTQQDNFGATIKIEYKSDNYTYHFKPHHTINIKNPRVETEDGVELFKLVPNKSLVSGKLYLSSTDRRYIRNNQAYLVYQDQNNNQNTIKLPLNKIKIKPIPN